jgi:RimJ/RimL family protein N-acetyltransferase
VVRGALTTLRPATDADTVLLVDWHADPDVSRYWDGETFTSEEMLERLRRTNVEAFVVEAGDRPVGYLQAWREATKAGSTCSSFRTPAGVASARMLHALSRATFESSGAGHK